MKLRIVFAAVAAITLAGQVVAADYEYKHVHSERAGDWKNEAENWLNKVRPKLDGIQAGLSNGRDFHIWARKGDNGPPLEFKCIPRDQAVTAVTNLLKGMGAAVVGYNVSEGPAQCLWIIQLAG